MSDKEQIEALMRRVQELEDWQKRAIDYLLNIRASFVDLLKEYWEKGDQLSANIVKIRLELITALIAEAKE